MRFRHTLFKSEYKSIGVRSELEAKYKKACLLLVPKSAHFALVLSTRGTPDAYLQTAIAQSCIVKRTRCTCFNLRTTFRAWLCIFSHEMPASRSLPSLIGDWNIYILIWLLNSVHTISFYRKLHRRCLACACSIHICITSPQSTFECFGQKYPCYTTACLV